MSYLALYIVVSLLGMLAVAVLCSREWEKRSNERVVEAVQVGRQHGRGNIMAYRVIGNPAVRAYMKTKLAGSTVREAISHIQHVGLNKYWDAINDYARVTGIETLTDTLNMGEFAESIMDLACILEVEIVVDGVKFNPYSPTPTQDVFKVIYF